MTNCRVKVGGKSLTKQELEAKIKSEGEPHFTLEHRPQDVLTIEEAKAITKAWMPKAKIEGEGT